MCDLSVCLSQVRICKPNITATVHDAVMKRHSYEVEDKIKAWFEDRCGPTQVRRNKMGPDVPIAIKIYSFKFIELSLEPLTSQVTLTVLTLPHISSVSCLIMTLN